jgi:hypothetical protein
VTADQAHDIACRALGNDPGVRQLIARHGEALYSSLCAPCDDTGGRWVELVLLGGGEATYVDGPGAKSVVVARCVIDPVSGEAQVVLEDGA